MNIVSHTLVKNGYPFLNMVLRSVEPYMSRMLITISEKSTDNSLDVIRRFEKEFQNKVRIYFENVDKVGELTRVRQKMVDNTYEDWILFLDDDDLWTKEGLEEMKDLIKEDLDGYAFSPIQVIDTQYYDYFWLKKKFFTKLFRNKNINYKNDFPRDTIFSGDTPLYWKFNDRVKRLQGKYFHLSNIKGHSFRKEEWAKDIYEESPARKFKYPDWCKPYLEKIYDRT